MKLAVLGVGLIGGSIGLAARGRLDADVSGFDSDSETLARAVELGAVDRATGSVADAVAGADAVFCAAPVGALPDLVESALEGTGAETVVTDVGSTKRGLIERMGDSERFIGGHPLAGAETSGVENARADLFEGARWYLTPTAGSSGMLYDRLQRIVADIGARPQAVDPVTHDRMMATLSHLPHVIANALAGQAADTLGGEADRLPEVGPSFRDTARVAGANPSIWADIFATNREAVAAEIDGVVARLAEAAELIRSGDPDAVGRWQRAAAEDRRRLLDRELVGGPLRELRVVVANRPGTVAELALALGRAGVNIEDMALYPTSDMKSGAVSLWVAGDDEAARAVELIRGLGHTASLAGGDD
jgi:prephenate dehydrogenase